MDAMRVCRRLGAEKVYCIYRRSRAEAPARAEEVHHAEEEGIEIFYFSSFDETWKVDKEGDVGAYWGLWDKDGNLKYV